MEPNPVGPAVDDPRPADKRPFLALGAVLLLVGAALLVPVSRAWLEDEVVAPLQTQADPRAGARTGYTVASLAFWALLGAAFAWVAYHVVFERLGVPADRRFFLALAPYLLFGPLYHALLMAGALPYGTLIAYAAAEPPVYLTTAALALVGFAVGARFDGRWFEGALILGGLALAPLLVLAATIVEPEALERALILLGVALAAALAVAFAYHKARPRDPFPAALAVVGAHALDGATTWMVLRDPLGLGFHSFAEKNPISLALVSIANGWPYFAVKLVLPVALLVAVRVEEGQERLHAFLLLAIFVLGYGPGMSNLLQVLLG